MFFDGSASRCAFDLTTTTTTATAATVPDATTPWCIYGRLLYYGHDYCTGGGEQWISPVFESEPSENAAEYDVFPSAPGISKVWVMSVRPAECTPTRPASCVDNRTLSTTTTTSTTTVATTTTTTPFFTEFTSADQLVATGIVASVAAVAVGLVIVNIIQRRRSARRYAA